MTTTNLSDFGSIELQMAADLLQHYAAKRYKHPYWSNSGVQILMNKRSRYVFLTDDDCNVLMMNGSRLMPYYTLPYSGEEGFLDDFKIDATYHREDVDYYEDIMSATQP